MQCGRRNQIREGATMAESNPQTVVLSGAGARTVELPLLEGSMASGGGRPQALRADGLVHLRPRLHLTASCTSKITFIDGEEGILLHRGYSIEDLATTTSWRWLT